MPSKTETLNPAQVDNLLRTDRAVLVDIREPDEFARSRIKGAQSHPLSAFDPANLRLKPGQVPVFSCRSGMRTQTNADKLAAGVQGPLLLLEGGLDGWAQAGLPLWENRKAPLEIMRQVQLAAGILVTAGVVLGFAVHPAFFILSGAVGVGLAMAGATGFCGMARLLALMPWNRSART